VVSPPSEEEPALGGTGSTTEEEEPGGDLDPADLLVAFEDAGGLDDAADGDLDPGIPLASEDDAEVDEPEGAPLDVGDALLPEEDDDSLLSEGDDTGPSEHEEGLGLEEAGEAEGDDEEGVTEQLADLVPGELPSLDASAHADEEPAEEPFSLPVTEDEESLRPGERPWIAVPLPGASSPRSWVSHSGARTLSAGASIVEVHDDGREQVLVPAVRGTVCGLIALPSSEGILFVTRSGELFRADGKGGEAVAVHAFRDAVEVGAETAFDLSLGGPTPSTRPALLLHLQNLGALLESTDQGTTFRRVDLGGKVRLLGTGTPPLCIVEAHGEPRLLRSEPTGGFGSVGREWPRDADVTAIAAHSEVVALLEPGRGVHVSVDAGVTFRQIAGTARATAISVGTLAGRPCAFGALFDTATARSVIVWIDGITGEARIVTDLTLAIDDDDDGEAAWVHSLSWDAHTGTLWAAGQFGLRRFRPPASA